MSLLEVDALPMVRLKVTLGWTYMKAKQPPRFEELPDILTPKELLDYLPIGRDAIYNALQSQAIRNVRIGQKFLIPREALREFLGDDVE